MTEAAAPPVAEARPRIAPVLLTPAILILALNLRMGIASVGPVLPQVVGDLGTTLVYGSLLTTAPVVMMGLASPLSARLGARIGLERTVVVAIAVICIATAARYWATSPVVLLATAVALGVGIAAGNTMLPAVVRRYFPQQAALMTGLYAVGINAGAGTAAFATPRLASSLASTWRGALAVWSLAALLAFILWAVVALRVHRQPHMRGLTASGPVRQSWLTAACFFGLQSVVYYAVLAWLAPLYEERGWSKASAGLLLSFFTAMQVVGALSCSIAVQRSGRLAAGLRLATVVSGVGLLLVGLAPTIAPWLWIVVLGFGVGGIFPLSLTVPLALTSSIDTARRLTSKMLFYGYLLGASGPFLVSLLRTATRGFAVPFTLLALLAGLVALVLVQPLLRSSTERHP